MSAVAQPVPLLRHHATRRGRKTQKSDAWHSTSKAELALAHVGRLLARE